MPGVLTPGIFIWEIEMQIKRIRALPNGNILYFGCDRVIIENKYGTTKEKLINNIREEDEYNTTIFNSSLKRISH